MQLLSVLLATSITATELLQTKAHTWSLQGPSCFFLWAFHLCNQSGRREVTEGPQASFRSRMIQLLLPPPPRGWRVGCRFWRCVREQRQPASGSTPGPPRGRHQDRDAGRSSCPECPRQAVVHLACSGSSSPGITNKAENRESLSVAEHFMSL